MATVKLNLLMEQSVVEKMKAYAAAHRTSISRMAENVFTAIVSSSSNEKEAAEISPMVKSLSITTLKFPMVLTIKRS
jgi:hypothetical protein